MHFIIILIVCLSMISACKMTVRPRLCFACSYLTMFSDDSPLGHIRVKQACNNIKDKCCMKKRNPNREKVDRRSVRKNDMLRRKFLI